MGVALVVLGAVVTFIAALVIWALGSLTAASIDLVSILGALVFVLAALAMGLLATLGPRSS